MQDGESLEIPSIVPIFPLPEVVLFPRALLPLHIFEPRYLEMTADALSGCRLIAVSLLKPGFEPLYYTRRAPIHRVVGLGRIVADEKLPDGNYNILLHGIARARLVREMPHRPYRVARLACVESETDYAGAQLQSLRRVLRETIEHDCVCARELHEHWLRLFDSPLELGDLADLIGSVLPIDAELRQELLAQPDPVARALRVRCHIQTLAAVARTRRKDPIPTEWKLN